MPVLLCAAILLIAGLAFNLAYLDTGGESLPAPPGTGSPSPRPLGLLDPETASILLIAAFATALAVMIVMILRRREPGARRVLRPSTWADLVAIVVGFGMLAGFLFLWPRLAALSDASGAAGNGNASAAGNVTSTPSFSGIPLGAFVAAALFAAVLLIAFMFRTSTRLDRAGRGLGPSPRASATHAVERAIAALETGGDVRQAILACYARFCGFLRVRGFPAQAPLTPRELEDLAVRRLAVTWDSAEALTALFEEARYSEHALGEPDRERALRSLERIRTDLEA